MQVRVAVLAHNKDGVPTFFMCNVTCSQEQYDVDDHYNEATDQAVEAGLEYPMIHFSEEDMAGKQAAELAAFFA